MPEAQRLKLLSLKFPLAWAMAEGVESVLVVLYGSFSARILQMTSSRGLRLGKEGGYR